MELRNIMAINYIADRLDDICYTCDVRYTCLHCDNTVEYWGTSDFDVTIFYKTVAECPVCHQKCIVHNPKPE